MSDEKKQRFGGALSEFGAEEKDVRYLLAVFIIRS
jgi:hypothetical protein